MGKNSVNLDDLSTLQCVAILYLRLRKIQVNIGDSLSVQ